MRTGTIFSGIGHAGLILWVLVGEWMFPARPAEEVVVTVTTIISTADFAALQTASTPVPGEASVPVRPAPRPAPLPEPEPEAPPEPEPEPEPPPPAPPAEEEQPLPSPATEANPTPEAAEIVAPSPVEVETEAETSDDPEPAVTDAPREAEVVEDRPAEATVAEDTGDVLATEANREDTAATGMTTSLRPRARPEQVPEPAVAAVPEAPAEPPVDDRAAEDMLAALLAEAVAEPGAEPGDTGGPDLPQGPPLSGSEMGNISSSIARKWNLGASSTDALRTMVVVRVSFLPDGRPTGFELIEADGPSQAAIDNIFRTARSAVSRAHADGGLPLPPDKYATWRVLDLVFDANGMALR